ncbi:hypothetical protein BC939DRAFT_25874 [Gamsiella multidivaricata]|uniref:uncharacterized protein n=1 Tax=Gamsiella multidivaricata TaxID=101098 RepID=UPI002220BB68|nr:uncharacterized protein BC939DRAFT_25874 [Gamsiella multidivaricata]KAI7829416.1 hypothetical protein BC939DRAFT_25874 [Gamsiella multidivaricata]
MFTTAILHLLWACPINVCTDLEPEFPQQFFKAMVATFYFMGGRYDPVSSLFVSDNYGFLLLMVVNLFFTGILMMNVLIALINVAFTTGDESWQLVWLKNKLRYIESAENMTFHIPGFREAHDWFPDEIYYSATPQQVKAYEEKYLENSNKSSGSLRKLFGQTSSTTAAAAAAASDAASASASASADATITTPHSQGDSSPAKTDDAATANTSSKEDIEMPRGADEDDLDARIQRSRFLRGRVKERVKERVGEGQEDMLKELLTVQLKEHLAVQLKEELTVQLREQLTLQLKEQLALQLREQLAIQLKELLGTQLKEQMAAQLESLQDNLVNLLTAKSQDNA